MSLYTLVAKAIAPKPNCSQHLYKQMLVCRFAVAGNVDGIRPNIVASDAKVVQTAAL